MSVLTLFHTSRSVWGDRLRPPITHEHGAWMMLYAPFTIMAILLRPAEWDGSVALFIAVTFLYLARNCAAIVMRRRRGWESAAAWLAFYAGIAAAALWPILSGPGGGSLLMVAAIGALLILIHSAL